MFKNRRLGPVVGGQLPNIKLCVPCQERFKAHMNLYLPATPNNGDEPIPMPDFVLCDVCWNRLMDEAEISKEDQVKIHQGAAVTVH